MTGQRTNAAIPSRSFYSQNQLCTKGGQTDRKSWVLLFSHNKQLHWEELNERESKEEDIKGYKNGDFQLPGNIIIHQKLLVLKLLQFN